jgi:hypothetical protein
MVLKIGKTDATSEADGTATDSQSFDPPPSKKQKKPDEASHPQAVAGNLSIGLLCAMRGRGRSNLTNAALDEPHVHCR